MSAPTEHWQALEQWLYSRELQQQSPHTLVAYRRDVQDFLRFCEQQRLTLSQLQRADIQQYLVQKIDQDQLKNKSLQRRLSAIRQFMQWFSLQHQLEQTATKDLTIRQQNKRLPGLLDEQLIVQLLEQSPPEHERQKQLWIRDRAILELFYSSGLRLSELQSLCLKDVDFARRLINVVGKGNKNRIVPFGSFAEQQLRAWLDIYTLWINCPLAEFQADFPLFISQQGNALSARQIENRVKFQAERAGIATNLHPHLLRHCFASHLLSRSGDLRAVQELLGHENLSTTEIYTHLNFAELQQKYRDHHPHARRKPV
ncbi:MAG: tyrosine recombinase XerC [Acinetobacter sp.]|nr:tyrosine recombinase XerC [Acinetobacter sp.]